MQIAWNTKAYFLKKKKRKKKKCFYLWYNEYAHGLRKVNNQLILYDDEDLSHTLSGEKTECSHPANVNTLHAE